MYNAKTCQQHFKQLTCSLIFLSSTLHRHHFSVPVFCYVWGLWSWIHHVSICPLFGAQREQTEELQVWWRGMNVGVLITYVDVQHLVKMATYFRRTRNSENNSNYKCCTCFLVQSCETAGVK